jgi:hypothetical protein
LEGLGDSIVQKPFLWYGKLFLRITHAISRRQEFAADALAAGIVGRQPMIAGLQKVHSAAQAFDAYWRGEAVPVLSAGYRPSLTEGFSRFLGEQTITKLVNESLGEAMRVAKSDAYDTHPALPERIAALEALPAGPVAAADPPAIGLLANVAALEHELLVSLAGADMVGKLKPVNWEEVGEQVFLPQWREVATKHAKALAGVTPATLPGRGAEFTQAVAQAGGEALSATEQARLAGQVVGCALAVALHARGQVMRCVPGAPVSFQAGTETVQPFGVWAELADGTLAAADWHRACAAFGIANADLRGPV